MIKSTTSSSLNNGTENGPPQQRLLNFDVNIRAALYKTQQYHPDLSLVKSIMMSVVSHPLYRRVIMHAFHHLKADATTSAANDTFKAHCKSMLTKYSESFSGINASDVPQTADDIISSIFFHLNSMNKLIDLKKANDDFTPLHRPNTNQKFNTNAGKILKFMNLVIFMAASFIYGEAWALENVVFMGSNSTTYKKHLLLNSVVTKIPKGNKEMDSVQNTLLTCSFSGALFPLVVDILNSPLVFHVHLKNYKTGEERRMKPEYFYVRLPANGQSGVESEYVLTGVISENKDANTGYSYYHIVYDSTTSKIMVFKLNKGVVKLLNGDQIEGVFNRSVILNYTRRDVVLDHQAKYFEHLKEPAEEISESKTPSKNPVKGTRKRKSGASFNKDGPSSKQQRTKGLGDDDVDAKEVLHYYESLEPADRTSYQSFKQAQVPTSLSYATLRVFLNVLIVKIKQIIESLKEEPYYKELQMTASNHHNEDEEDDFDPEYNINFPCDTYDAEEYADMAQEDIDNLVTFHKITQNFPYLPGSITFPVFCAILAQLNDTDMLNYYLFMCMDHIHKLNHEVRNLSTSEINSVPHAELGLTWMHRMQSEDQDTFFTTILNSPAAYDIYKKYHEACSANCKPTSQETPGSKQRISVYSCDDETLNSNEYLSFHQKEFINARRIGEVLTEAFGQDIDQYVDKLSFRFPLFAILIRTLGYPSLDTYRMECTLNFLYNSMADLTLEMIHLVRAQKLGRSNQGAFLNIEFVGLIYFMILQDIEEYKTSKQWRYKNRHQENDFHPAAGYAGGILIPFQERKISHGVLSYFHLFRYLQSFMGIYQRYMDLPGNTELKTVSDYIPKNIENHFYRLRLFDYRHGNYKCTRMEIPWYEVYKMIYNKPMKQINVHYKPDTDPYLVHADRMSGGTVSKFFSPEMEAMSNRPIVSRFGIEMFLPELFEEHSVFEMSENKIFDNKQDADGFRLLWYCITSFMGFLNVKSAFYKETRPEYSELIERLYLLYNELINNYMKPSDVHIHSKVFDGANRNMVYQEVHRGNTDSIRSDLFDSIHYLTYTSKTHPDFEHLVDVIGPNQMISMVEEFYLGATIPITRAIEFVFKRPSYQGKDFTTRDIEIKSYYLFYIIFSRFYNMNIKDMKEKNEQIRDYFIHLYGHDFLDQLYVDPENAKVKKILNNFDASENNKIYMYFSHSNADRANYISRCICDTQFVSKRIMDLLLGSTFISHAERANVDETDIREDIDDHCVLLFDKLAQHNPASLKQILKMVLDLYPKDGNIFFSGMTIQFVQARVIEVSLKTIKKYLDRIEAFGGDRAFFQSLIREADLIKPLVVTQILEDAFGNVFGHQCF